MFESADHVFSLLKKNDYIASQRIATTVFLAYKLQRPLLIEGPAGVGKTDLARAVAQSASLDLIRLQCYEGLDETRALYEWEYGKQLLYTQLLREGFTSRGKDTEKSMDDLDSEAGHFFSERFLIERPLLQAVKKGSTSLLLIDEVDKTDAEFEAFLLEMLSEFQVTIPEMGTIKSETRPLVFLTSNSERDLTEALKRRCLHLHIDYPTPELEDAILKQRVPDAPEEMRKNIVEVLARMRKLQLRKGPSIAETIDWVNSLLILGRDSVDYDTFEETLNVLLKYQGDIELALSKSETILQ
jgi:MoxR-like ATPase